MRRFGRRFGWMLAAALVAASGGTAALAEMDINGPSEVPPTSWKGRQYVDSVGCVFVRAGYGGTVNWVPRVSRDKRQLCGYKPTFQGGEAVLDVARAAPAPAAPAPAPAQPAKAAPVAAAAPAAAASQRVAAQRPVSPFAPTPFVGAPMATIALTDTPPRIGRAGVAAPAAAAAAVAALPAAAPVAPVKLAMAPVVSAPAPTPGPAPSRSGYVSPYVSGAVGAGSVRYHNATALPLAAAAPVTITGSETVSGSATSCPRGTQSAQRYRLSDGRSVVRCGAQADDPASFINAAAVPGLVVAAAPVGLATATMVGGTGYAVTPLAVDYGAAPTAPMIGGTGYAVAQVGPAAAYGSQQAYAAASPYQARGGAVVAQGYSASSYAAPAAPAAVTVRNAAGLTTLAPVVVSTQIGEGGYAAAFEDGRLNPYRGPRSGWGDAQQGMIWTNEVPSKPVTARTPARKRIVPVEAVEVTGYVPAGVSSKSLPVAVTPPQAAAPRYVQVGTFAVPGNASAAKARLSAAGLPVASSTTRRGLTVVLAGPFADARMALASVRAAGFGEALLR